MDGRDTEALNYASRPCAPDCRAAAFGRLAAERPNIVFIFADDCGLGGSRLSWTSSRQDSKRRSVDGRRDRFAPVHGGERSLPAEPNGRDDRTSPRSLQHQHINGHFAWVPSNTKRNMPDWLDTPEPLLSPSFRGVDFSHLGQPASPGIFSRFFDVSCPIRRFRGKYL